MAKEEDKIKEIGEILDSLGFDQRIVCGMESGHEIEHMLVLVEGKTKVVLTMVASVIYKISDQLNMNPMDLFLELATTANKASNAMDKMNQTLGKNDKISIEVKGDGTSPEDIKVKINKD